MPVLIQYSIAATALAVLFFLAWFVRSRLNSISQSALILDVLARNRAFMPLCIGVEIQDSQGRRLGGAQAQYQPGDKLHRRADFNWGNVSTLDAWPGGKITAVYCNGAGVMDRLYPLLHVDFSEPLSGRFQVDMEPI